jgi:hypothetical protein
MDKFKVTKTSYKLFYCGDEEEIKFYIYKFSISTYEVLFLNKGVILYFLVLAGLLKIFFNVSVT